MIISFSVSSQNYFRSGIFLHHSTGQYIWGPNPDGNSTTDIPEQMHNYNMLHSYQGNDSITMNEEWWAPSDNEWSTQHEFFEGNTSYTDINDYLSNNKIIVIKSCFPSSAIEAWGSPSDTLSPTYKSVYNYKWHWRHIIKVMKNHPDNFFAIWTNAPLETSSTTTDEALRSKSFCKWAKDTLAQGLDPVTGAFPHNVFIFDFFSKLTNANGMMLTQFRTSEYDSHPNGQATDLIAPQFVQEIFNAAIAYESYYTNVSGRDILEKPVCIYPNPATDKIQMNIIPDKTIEVINLQGEIVMYMNHSEKQELDVSRLPESFYIVKIMTKDGIFIGNFVKN